jgi:hypothetical protein
LGGEFIQSNLEYQIVPSHEWISLDSEFTLGESGVLTHSIDKYFGEFSGVVKVDDVALSAGDFIASDGSTVIELSNAFLNSLGAGNHTLSVGFYGGVWVDGQFGVLARGASGCTSNCVSDNPSAPNTGANTSVRDTGRAVASLFGASVGVTIVGLVLVKRRLLAKRG